MPEFIKICATFSQNFSIYCGDIVIFRFFKMVTTAILDFPNSEILLADRFQKVETDRHVKFYRNRFFR